MKTWLAPEMPRPGCVWTHVLLISFQSLDSIGDLRLLMPLLQRPSKFQKLSPYSEPLSLPVAEEGFVLDLPIPRLIRLLRSVYLSREAVELQADFGELDEAIFSVWSQQWPSLRKTFSFRTAGVAGESPGQQFDLRLFQTRAFQDHYPDKHDIEPSKAAGWELAAARDISIGNDSPLRAFLWRYGNDVRRGRGRFAFLVQLFVAFTTKPLPEYSDSSLEALLLAVAERFPEREDAKTLKNDLIRTANARNSIFPPGNAWDIVNAFIKHSTLVSFEPLSPVEIEALIDQDSQTNEIAFVMGSAACRAQTDFAKIYLNVLSKAIDPARFVEQTAEDLLLRKSLVIRNPALLDVENITQIAEMELPTLLAFLPRGEDVIDRTVSRLLRLDSRIIADYMIGRFPDVVLHHLASSFKDSPEGYMPVPGTWLNAAADHAYELLTSGFLKKIKSTCDFAMFASILGFRNHESAESSSVSWAKALTNARDDVFGFQRQMLLSFLLSLGLSNPLPGCEPLFEKAFERIHEDLWSAHLPHRASVLLERLLPEVHWWQQWDTCLRLRRAVCTAYVTGRLDPASFKRLASNSTLLGRLVEEIDDSPDGQKFRRQICA
jgi:hypothetical protein